MIDRHVASTGGYVEGRRAPIESRQETCATTATSFNDHGAVRPHARNDVRR